MTRHSSINFTISKEIRLLASFYTLMHGGLLLLPNAIYWDDWVLYQTDPEIILTTFSQVGAILNWSGYLHVGLLELGPWSYKLLTFLLMFFAGLLFNSILKSNGYLTREFRFLVVLFFMVLPLYTARIALIDFPYTLNYFVFFLAWWLVDKNRVAALVFFFISFNTNSMLVFYVLPMLDMMYRSIKVLDFRSLFSFAMKHAAFLLLPFVFFFVKTQFFAPYGIYEGRNESLSLMNYLPYSVKTQLADLALIEINPYLWLLLLPFVYFALRLAVGSETSASQPRWQRRKIFVIGVFAAVLGMFPYWVTENAPTFYEWTSRHQLLMPLGTALALVAILSLFKEPIRRVAVALTVSASLAFGIVTYYTFYIDWEKQSAIMKLFSENPRVRHSDLLIINDRTSDLNAIKRVYRFYEWNGLLVAALGDQRRFALRVDELPRYLDGSYDRFFTAHYKAESHRRDGVEQVILVNIDQAESQHAGESSLIRFSADIEISTVELDIDDLPQSLADLI